MRNLKRVLSLALAAMMLIGMMVVGASAAGNYDDFTDKDKIVNTEAVQVLNALDVINGKEDGSYFDPTGSVTRAEMAKMITIICLGNVDVSAFSGTATDLKDIANNWAEAYIKYCYSQGIIAGRGNGVFDPTANVTTSEAAKMLLVAIGYNSSVQGYEGSQWAINVTRDAQISGFFEDLSVTSTQALTRDQAAQMIYNAMQAQTITKSSSVDRVDGSITDIYEANGDSLLKKTFGVVEAEGIMTGISYNSDKAEYTYTVGGNTFKFASDVSGLFQQNVTVLYKVNKDSTKTVYGIYADKGSVVAEATLGDIDWTNYTADVAKKIVTISGTEYDLTGTSVAFYAMKATAADTDETTAKSAAAKGYTMKAIDNTDDGKVDVIVYVPFTVAKVTYVGSTSVTMDNSVGNKKLADIDVYSGIAKDDMVVVTAAANTAKGVDTVVKADVVSGKVTSTKGSPVTDIAVDGTWYTLANSVTVTLGTEYNLTVVNGYVYAKDNVTSEVKVSDYAVVTNAETRPAWDAEYAKAVLLFADGTTKTVDVKTAATKGALVTYSVSDDVYTLKAATANTTSSSADYCGFDVADITSASYATKTDKMTIGSNTYSVADDAVIFVKVTGTTDSYKVMTGADLKKMDTVTSVTAAYGTKDASTAFTTVTMAYITTTSTGASNDATYGYVTADLVAVQDKDNNTVYEITLGDGTKLTTKNGVSVTGIQKGSVISYKLTDGLVSTLTEVADTKDSVGGNGVAITAYDGTILTVDRDSKTYEVTSDTVILYVDSSNSTLAEGGNVSLAVKDSGSNYVANAAIDAATTANSDGNYELNLLVVDVNNNFYNADIT